MKPSFVKIAFVALLSLLSNSLIARAKIDQNVIDAVQQKSMTNQSIISLIVFLHSDIEKKEFLKDISRFPNLQFLDLSFMPAVAITIPATLSKVNELANHYEIAQISLYKPGKEELDITAQVLKLSPSIFYPDVSNWWDAGYTGHDGIIGLIDDGIDITHPALANKTLVIRKEGGSHYSDYVHGVRSAHGTGVACIYSSNDKVHKGIAYGAKTLVHGLSGTETADITSLMLTLGSLDWMLERSGVRPTIINYSMGNGPLSCQDCPEWSGFAKIIDYVVNHEKILWVKSAGNSGYIESTSRIPFASTLTVPGDNYNALTVANMNTIVSQNGVSYKTAYRTNHHIKETSSRGPTPYGRKKPDISAPGHDTRTCAPDSSIYNLIKYSEAMDYHDGFRLMGGTSSAAPHVGAAALLIEDAGITEPMAIKALLINSADAWTDSGTIEHINRPSYETHYEVMGSEWNRTYGWGYINMEKAFQQREHITLAALSLDNNIHEYPALLAIGDKVTLVHERRVGYFGSNHEWSLSHLALEMIDLDTGVLIARDDSAIDTVHQVSNCIKSPGDAVCTKETKPLRALIRVILLDNKIDGSPTEPYALVLKKN